MIEFEPLNGTLLDLARAVAPLNVPLTVGGGYGLFLKQEHLRSTGQRTLIPILPPPRSTSDIDLFLRAEVLVQLETMKQFAKVLEMLEFVAIERSKYFQWERRNGKAPKVILDLLVGPIDEFKARLKTNKPPRIRPKGDDIQLHAHLTEEAIGIDTRSMPITVTGSCTDGTPHEAEIFIPPAFTYLMMKLFAFDDRKDDPAKDEGRHHAMDIYRIVAMLTESEYLETRQMSSIYAQEKHTLRSRSIIAKCFSSRFSLGTLRLREHPLYRDGFPLDQFMTELTRLFEPAAHQ